MYDWTLYAIGGFGPDGKALPGLYLSGKFPAAPDKLKGYPPELRTSVIGPVTAAGGGIPSLWRSWRDEEADEKEGQHSSYRFDVRPASSSG